LKLESIGWLQSKRLSSSDIKKIKQGYTYVCASLVMLKHVLTDSNPGKELCKKRKGNKGYFRRAPLVENEKLFKFFIQIN
jgi:hypothetical protein